MTNGGPGDTTELVGLLSFAPASRRSRSGMHQLWRLSPCLIAIAFASIYLYVLNYRETRAQLK